MHTFRDTKLTLLLPYKWWGCHTAAWCLSLQLDPTCGCTRWTMTRVRAMHSICGVTQGDRCQCPPVSQPAVAGNTLSYSRTADVPYRVQ